MTSPTPPPRAPLATAIGALGALATLATLAALTTTPATPAQATPGDYTGSALAAAGDLDGDGFTDYLVGSPGAQSAKGRVDVYYGNASGTLQRRLSLSSIEFGSAFGRAVAGLGDVNSDGFDDVAIGQPLYAGGGATRGAVWVYLGSDTGLVADGARIEGSLAQGEFGAAVARAGDINSDGYADVLIGAPYAQRAGVGVPALHGVAYLYYGSELGVDITNPVILSGSATRQYRGFAVSAAGDIDGDGYADVAIGAPGQETDFVQGRIYLYRGSATGLQPAPAESIAAGSRSGCFGAALASVGDRDGDGRRDLAIGSPNDSTDTEVEAGRVFLRRSASPFVVGVLRGGTQAGAHLGAALADAQDFDADGRGEILIGEPDYDGAVSIDEGRAHLLFGAGDSSRTLNSAVAFSQFGLAVAGIGDVDKDGAADIAIGAPGTPEGGAVTIVLGDGIEPPGDTTPTTVRLLPPFPNPSLAAGSIALWCRIPPGTSGLRASIHDATGRLVRDLSDEVQDFDTAIYVAWDGRDDASRPTNAGIYFARFIAGGQASTQKFVRVR